MPEALETGEYKVQGTAEFDELEPINCIAYTGDKISERKISQSGYTYNGVFSSVVFVFGNEGGFQTLLNVLNSTADSDKILSAFSIPRLAILDKVKEIESSFPEGTRGYYFEPMTYNYEQNPVTKTLLGTPTTLDGYKPRNQKLRTYPYVYVGFNPSNGNSKIFRYEDFENGIPTFDLYSEINQNPTVAFIPKNYRGSVGDSLSDVVYLNGYPTISYKTDVFNTWLAQNSNLIQVSREHEENIYNINRTANITQGTLGTVSNIANGSAGGAINNITNTIFQGAYREENHDYYVKNQMAQIEQHKLLPDNATLSSSNATLLGYGKMDKNIFTRYTIKEEFAKKIDKYFDMYGYLTNETKIPNSINRPNWNYVKTIGANILGNIPQIDLAEIKQLFDNGITLWHNPNTYLDYSQNNR